MNTRTQSKPQKENLQNVVMHNMLGCATLAVDYLTQCNITIVALTLQGKPVITVLHSPELTGITHNGGWKMIICKCPLDGLFYKHCFVELYGCTVTWQTPHYDCKTGVTNHVTH